MVLAGQGVLTFISLGTDTQVKGKVLPSGQVVWEDGAGEKPTKTSTRSGERPVRDDGQRQCKGRAGSGAEAGRGRSRGTSETPTSATPRGQCENGEKHEMR